jgi:adenylosuccinate synthase
VTELAVMHLDTLATFPEVRICKGYQVHGHPLPVFPPAVHTLQGVDPVYETLPGWTEEISNVREYEQLPAEACRYLDRLEELLGVPITLVSVGPDRRATLHRKPQQSASAIWT